MANTKISQLTATTTPTWNEEMVYALNNANGKVTLNTVKTFVTPDLSWYQEKLISWTNIKTVNNNSLLWSWNIEIPWWGGDWQVLYDAIVDASGNWDYTTLWDALTAWMTSIYIKNWTYTETPVTVTDNSFYIQWETEGWVILNYETTTATPYCIKFLMSTKTALTDHIYHTIKNVTFNIDMQSGNYATNWTTVVNAWSNNAAPFYNYLMDSCTINVVKSATWSESFAPMNIAGASLWNKWGWFWVMRNCLIKLTNSAGNTSLVTWYDDANSDEDRCLLEWCKIWVTSSTSWWVYMMTYSCSYVWCDIVLSARPWTWSCRPSLSYMYNCNINLIADYNKWVMWDVSNMVWCAVDITNWVTRPSWFSWTTPVSEFASSTAYSVWDYVTSWWAALYKCKEAHTSWDYMDYSKRDAINTFKLWSDVSWCRITSSSSFMTISNATVTWNILQCETICVWAWSRVTWNNIANVKIVKPMWKWIIFTSNSLSWFSSSTTWERWLYYNDDYSIIKDNTLSWSYSPTVSIVWTTTSTSKVSDNVIY